MNSESSRVTALQQINELLKRQLDQKQSIIYKLTDRVNESRISPQPSDRKLKQMKALCLELENRLVQDRQTYLRELQKARSEYSLEVEFLKQKALASYEAASRLGVQNESLRKRIEVLQQFAELKK